MSDHEIAPALSRFLGALPARPRLLGLGEPVHGVPEFLRARDALFRWLVQHEGYRSIALETDVLAARVVDDYVRGGPGELDEVLAAGFSHGFGPANRELVAWMREHNTDRDAADRVRFDGFDAPLEITRAESPRGPLAHVRSYLAAHVDTARMPAAADGLEELAGPDERWTDPAAVLDATRSAGDSPDARALRLLADDLAALLDTEAPGLVAATSADEWRRARLHARTAVGLLRYHAVLADPADTRIERALAQRDAMMAENLRDIADRETRRGPTLVFAQNRHLQRTPSTWSMIGIPMRWWSAGAITATALGDGYAFVAIALGSAPARGLGEPAPDTVEAVLARLGPGLHPAAQVRGRASAVRTDTTADGGYLPLHPEHLDGADAVLFLPEA